MDNFPVRITLNMTLDELAEFIGIDGDVFSNFESALDKKCVANIVCTIEPEEYVELPF